MLRKIISFCFACLICVPLFAAQNIMTGTAYVNITSDTAANAKSMAMAEARRQILFDILSPYADSTALKDFLYFSNDNTLMNLIPSSRIEGEKSSKTTYSANIYMNVDMAYARQWLNDNYIYNWIPNNTDQVVDKSMIFVDIADLYQWIDFNNVVRESGLTFEISRIFDGRASITVANSDMAQMLLSLHNMGWQYSKTDEIIRLWR